jgi:hypothetical protein
MTNTLKNSSISKIEIVERLVINATNEGNYGLALDTVAEFVGSITSNPRSVGKVFSSPKLDKLCEAIGKKIAKLDLNLELNLASSGTVILVTQIVDSGGHIELIKDYIRLGILEDPITVLVTRYFAETDPDSINRFKSALTKEVSVVICTEDDTNKKLKFLQSFLSMHPPNELYLMVSNHDSLAVSLLSSINSIVKFIHHGDHHLCLGVHCNNFIHIDPHNLGYFNCLYELGVKDNRYWPLVIKSNQPRTVVRNMLVKEGSSGLTTCSCGRYQKFLTNGYRYDYFHIIPKILYITNGVHIHIGELPDNRLEDIRHELRKLGLNPDIFVHIKHVMSLATSLIENEVNLYISSFPIAGGKASLEAMSVGVPLLMHVNFSSYFLSGIDLVYPEAFSWFDEESLFITLKKICSENLKTHAIKAKLFFDKHYSDEAFFKFHGRVDVLHEIPKVNKNGESAMVNFLENDQIYIEYNSLKKELENKKLELENQKIELNELNEFKLSIIRSRRWRLLSLLNYVIKK